MRTVASPRRRDAREQRTHHRRRDPLEHPGGSLHEGWPDRARGHDENGAVTGLRQQLGVGRVEQRRRVHQDDLEAGAERSQDVGQATGVGQDAEAAAIADRKPCRPATVRRQQRLVGGGGAAQQAREPRRGPCRFVARVRVAGVGFERERLDAQRRQRRRQLEHGRGRTRLAAHPGEDHVARAVRMALALDREGKTTQLVAAERPGTRVAPCEQPAERREAQRALEVLGNTQARVDEVEHDRRRQAEHEASGEHHAEQLGAATAGGDLRIARRRGEPYEAGGVRLELQERDALLDLVDLLLVVGAAALEPGRFVEQTAEPGDLAALLLDDRGKRGHGETCLLDRRLGVRALLGSAGVALVEDDGAVALQRRRGRALYLGVDVGDLAREPGTARVRFRQAAELQEQRAAALVEDRLDVAQHAVAVDRREHRAVELDLVLPGEIRVDRGEA